MQGGTAVRSVSERKEGEWGKEERMDAKAIDGGIPGSRQESLITGSINMGVCERGYTSITETEKTLCTKES